MISQASWIWCSAAPETENQHALFRRDFQVASGRADATIQICADTRYRLYLNGKQIGEGPARYAASEPRYDTYNFAPHLRAGRNVIAVHVHAYGSVRRCSSCIPIRAGLIASLALGNETVQTDDQWKTVSYDAYASDTPRHSNHQGFVECFDARKQLADWHAVEFDDSSWQPATILGKTDELPPWQRLLPRAVKMQTRSPRLPARAIEAGRLQFADDHDGEAIADLAPALEQAKRQSDSRAARFESPASILPINLADGYVILDFAENSAGFVNLQAEGQPGTILDLAYSESLFHGTFEANKQGVRYVDRIILGESPVDHTIMLPKTFRYLLINARGKATINAVQHEVSHYPVRYEGRFYSSDPMLDAAWRVGAHTVAISMEDVYLDTPRRERAGWLGDMMPQAMAAYHAFGEFDVARNSLALYLQSQDAPGIHVQYPADKPGWLLTRYPSIDPSPMPDYLASIAITVLDYVMFSGDTDFAKQYWQQLVNVTDYVAKHATEQGLIAFAKEDMIASGYILIDWAPLDRSGACASLNMLFCGHLKAMSALAHRIGNADESLAYKQQAEALAQVISDELFDDVRDCYVNNLVDGKRTKRAGYHENLLALIWKVGEDWQLDRIANDLFVGKHALPVWEPDENYEMYAMLHEGKVPEWDDSKLVPIGSPYFSYFALWSLFEAGKTTRALNTIRSQYGNCLATNATTLWEEYNGSKSHSHGWGAGPTAQLLRYIVGIQPTSPGFATCDIMPSFGDLKHASGSVPTPHGHISADWRIEGDAVTLNVDIPKGVSVRAGLANCEDMRCNGEKCHEQEYEFCGQWYRVEILEAGSHQLTATLKK